MWIWSARWLSLLWSILDNSEYGSIPVTAQRRMRWRPVGELGRAIIRDVGQRWLQVGPKSATSALPAANAGPMPYVYGEGCTLSYSNHCMGFLAEFPAPCPLCFTTGHGPPKKRGRLVWPRRRPQGRFFRHVKRKALYKSPSDPWKDTGCSVSAASCKGRLE